MYVVYWFSDILNHAFHTFYNHIAIEEGILGDFDANDLSYWLIPGTYEDD